MEAKASTCWGMVVEAMVERDVDVGDDGLEMEVGG